MKKIIAIFLITIFLCANTSIGQLLKVPNLLEHYKEHQKKVATSSISFVQFLKLHYSKKFNCLLIGTENGLSLFDGKKLKEIII